MGNVKTGLHEAILKSKKIRLEESKIRQQLIDSITNYTDAHGVRSVARLTGLTASFISEIRTGSKKFSLEVIERTAEKIQALSKI